MKKLITISLLTSSLLFATTMQETSKEAISFLKSGEPTKAYELLESSYKKGDFNNQTLFLLGTSAKEKGDLDNAIKYFELLISRDRGAHRVRLDLATMYYKKQNLTKAKELLKIVKASNPPKKVGDNIDNFLSAIDKGVPKNYSFSMSVGYVYDSNVNAGPKVDTVLMYNLPFTLNSDAKANSDNALKYSFGFNHMKQFKSFVLQSSIGLNITDYRKLDNLDSKSLSISSGPTWKDGKYTFSVPLVVNALKIGDEKRYYSFSKGVSPRVSYQYLPNLSFSGSLSFSNKIYHRTTDRESNSLMFAPSSRYLLNQSSWISFGGYVGSEDSQTDTYSNKSKGINIGYHKAISKTDNFFVSTNWNNTRYEEKEAAYTDSREDISRGINGSYSHYFSGSRINMTFNASYIKNSSNIDMYKYSRKQLGVDFSKNF